jgi:hypothetical protein
MNVHAFLCFAFIRGHAARAAQSQSVHRDLEELPESVALHVREFRIVDGVQDKNGASGFDGTVGRCGQFGERASQGCGGSVRVASGDSSEVREERVAESRSEGEHGH